MYNELSDKDKTIIKYAILLHDMAKEGINKDPGHAVMSSQYAKDILEKFNMPQSTKNRIIELVKNHHWFAQYNTGAMDNQMAATLFRNPEDFKIATIMAKADLSSVNETFHLQKMGVKSDYEFNSKFDEKTKEINPALESIKEKSNILLETPFIPSGNRNIPINEQYGIRTLNMTELSENENLFKYGFGPGVTKDNLRLLVHMTHGDKSSFDIVKSLMSDAANQSVWSISQLGVKNENTGVNANTYGGRSVGVMLDVDQANIANATYENIGSGYEKGIERFSKLLNKPADSKDRTYVRDKFIDELKNNGIELTENEYAQIAKYMYNKKHISQVNTIKIGDKTITKEQLVNAFTKSRDALFKGKEHSEIIGINPRITGVVVKYSKMENVPIDVVNFAKENKLPIILIGE